MTTDLIPFDFNGTEVRAIDRVGEPWFVLADLCRALDLSNPTMVADRLDPDGLSTAEVIDSMGRTQTARIVNESAMYEVVFLSRKPEARAFKRWITSEVIPAIRKHGGYLTPALAEQVLSDPDTIIRLATDLKTERAKRIEAEALAASSVAALEEASPKARAWETFLSGTGDMSVFDAAKALARADIVIGGNRLFRWLLEHRWCFRAADSAPRAMQDRIDAGHLRHKEQGHFHPGTGEWVVDPPQVRVTPKGLDLLAKRVGQVAA